MGDLRIEAQNILKAKRNIREDRYIQKSISEDSNIREKKIKSMRKFQERVQYQIDNFQKNLLDSANRGETLKIDIVKLNKRNLISWWREREETQERLEEYLPIKSSIVTFIDDINLEYLKDDIILDDTLKKLYNTIKDNDIYPEWRVKRDKIREIKSIYLEANPLISYKEKIEKLKRKKENRSRALVVAQSNSRKIEKVEDKHKQIIKKLIKSIFIFIGLLYFSVTILTIISNSIGFRTVTDSNSFIEIAWPYFLLKDFSNIADMFLFSLPIGLIISIYFAYKKSWEEFYIRFKTELKLF